MQAGNTPPAPRLAASDDSPAASATTLASELEVHRAYLLAVARLHLADGAAAEDVVQETLIAALAGHHAFEGRSSLRTWLTGVLKKKVVDALRTGNRTPVPVSTLAVPEERRGITRLFDEIGTWSAQPSAWDDPDAALAQGEFLRVLENCLGALPPAAARAFLLRELMELETPEVADALAIKPNHLGVVLYRARMALRECLTHNWFALAGRPP